MSQWAETIMLIGVPSRVSVVPTWPGERDGFAEKGVTVDDLVATDIVSLEMELRLLDEGLEHRCIHRGRRFAVDEAKEAALREPGALVSVVVRMREIVPERFVDAKPIAKNPRFELDEARRNRRRPRSRGEARVDRRSFIVNDVGFRRVARRATEERQCSTRGRATEASPPSEGLATSDEEPMSA